MSAPLPHATLAIIGGSGLYEMDALTNITEHRVVTPWGEPSEVLVHGTIGELPVVFLARHGRGHRLLPSEVPYRANIAALKMFGVKYVLSISAVGSLQEQMAPRHAVIPYQFLDFTKQRKSTFFGHGAIAHVSMAQPVCMSLAELLAEAVRQAGNLEMHLGGSYVCMEGPQFSSLAESLFYRSLDASVIGMTNMPEAKLAREAQMAYATLAMVTDYDCWHPREENVTAELAIANLQANVENAKSVTAKLAELLQIQLPASDAHTALADSLITPLEAMPSATREKIELLLR
jgi:5'-methylthioadenosine phosphorylase